jgi:XTP/dITP diphosphohydrolase
MKKILFATSNQGKLLEAQKLLAPFGFEVEQLEISYPEIQAESLEDVASFGIDWLLEKRGIKGYVMLEDAGLFIHALNDFPGVYSRYVFEKIGLEGTLKLLEEKDDRSAHFESVVAFKEEGKEDLIFEGRVDGEIAFEFRGENGFGYDSIFIPQGEEKTFAEMETEEKNKFSHRAQALSQLAEFLGKQ